MIIELDKLSESAEQVTGEERITVSGVIDTDQEITCSIDVSARKTGQTFYFQIIIKGIFSAHCHKCFQPGNFDIRTEFDMVVHRGGADKVRENRSDGDDYVYIPIGEQKFSLDKYIYENLIVNIPMRIVCEEDCRGLCPSCGVNLNEESCSCVPTVNSRWEALAALKKKLPKSQ